MSKKEKLLKRILSRPKDLRFEELEKVILMCGYWLERTHGSHCIYMNHKKEILTIPRKSPVKIYLIKYVVNILENCIEENLDNRP